VVHLQLYSKLFIGLFLVLQELFILLNHFFLLSSTYCHNLNQLQLVYLLLQKINISCFTCDFASIYFIYSSFTSTKKSSFIVVFKFVKLRCWFLFFIGILARSRRIDFLWLRIFSTHLFVYLKINKSFNTNILKYYLYKYAWIYNLSIILI